MMTRDETIAPRVYRHMSEHKKLEAKTGAVIAIHPAVLRHGQDQSIESIQKRAGFAPYDLVCWQVWTQASCFTLIILPLRLWYRPLWKRRAIELKHHLRTTMGKRCVIAPASLLDRQPRLQNARLVAACGRAQVSATDRFKLMAKLVECTSLSISDATALVTANDPAAAILNLVAERALALDPDRPIGPHTMITVRC